jgi:hypothetical protein
MEGEESSAAGKCQQERDTFWAEDRSTELYVAAKTLNT